MLKAKQSFKWSRFGLFSYAAWYILEESLRYVSEVPDNEVILVVVYFWCLVWESIYSNILKYTTVREK